MNTDMTEAEATALYLVYSYVIDRPESKQFRESLRKVCSEGNFLNGREIRKSFDELASFYEENAHQVRRDVDPTITVGDIKATKEMVEQCMVAVATVRI